MVARYSLVLDGAAIKELPVGDTLAGQATSGANSDITSLTGLTTALSAAQGGTGLTAAGTAGNVLTSTGSGWTSGAAPSSNGGATTTTSAVNITLTAASNRVQAVTMTVTALSVILPVATTLTTGGALFVIKNYGTNTFAVRNSAGTMLAPVAEGQVVSLYLSNNSTSAGVWAAGNESTTSFLSEILNSSTIAVNSTNIQVTGICALSATQAIVAYVITNSITNARTINISGSTMTLGAEITVGSGFAVNADIIAMSATQALYVGYDNICYTLNISGTTITAGTGVDAGADGSYRGLAKLSATRAIMSYPSGGYVFVRTLDISGTTITLNAALQGQASNSVYSAVAAFSASAVVVAWTDSSGYLRSNCWTIDGAGTLTQSSSTNNNNNVTTDYLSAIPLSSTTAMLLYSSSNTMKASTITFNSSTFTTTTGPEFNTGFYVNRIVGTPLTPTKVLVAFIGTGSVLQDFIITVSNTNALTANTPSAVTGNQAANASICALSTGQSICAYKNNSSTFANATLIETAL
jgi:hypothetical protein